MRDGFARSPKFLSETRPDQPHLAELAALERAVNDAFDAPDAAPLTIADVSAIAPERWSDIIFVPHPSASHLKLITNAYALWVTLKDEKASLAAAKLEQPDDIIVWRQDVTPKVPPYVCRGSDDVERNRERRSVRRPMRAPHRLRRSRFCPTSGSPAPAGMARYWVVNESDAHGIILQLRHSTANTPHPNQIFSALWPRTFIKRLTGTSRQR